MRLMTRDEQHRARRDRLDMVERVEVHELNLGGKFPVRGDSRSLWRASPRLLPAAQILSDLSIEGSDSRCKQLPKPFCSWRKPMPTTTPPGAPSRRYRVSAPPRVPRLRVTAG